MASALDGLRDMTQAVYGPAARRMPVFLHGRPAGRCVSWTGLSPGAEPPWGPMRGRHLIMHGHAVLVPSLLLSAAPQDVGPGVYPVMPDVADLARLGRVMHGDPEGFELLVTRWEALGRRDGG